MVDLLELELNEEDDINETFFPGSYNEFVLEENVYCSEFDDNVVMESTDSDKEDSNDYTK